MSSRTTTLVVFALIVFAAVAYVAWPTETKAPSPVPPAVTATSNPAIILNPPSSPKPSASTTPSTSPTPAFTGYQDPGKRFRIGIPQDWKASELKNGGNSIGVTLTKPTGEVIQVMLKTAVLNPTLDEWLENRDKEAQTAYEGKPSKKILTTKPTVVSGFPALERKEEWLAAGFTTVVTYVKAEGSVYVIELIPQTELAASELRSIYEAVIGSLVIGK